MPTKSEQEQGSLTNKVTTIDGHQLKQLIQASLTWLRANQQTVNSLNVFPVPDGDTGTNMVLTMQSAYDEITESQESNFGKVTHAVAHGALMGARGNSGVILSQIWRGFARTVDNFPQLDSPILVQALQTARDTAYKGVVRPVEGTILTVIKDIAAAVSESQYENMDLEELLEVIVKSADQSVQRTPDLLPVLKEAGVVDSGGKGLFYIFEGMLRFVQELSLDAATAVTLPLTEMTLAHTLEAIEPGQDFEVVVDFRPLGSLNLAHFYGELEQLGTSIQVGEGDGIYRLHIHVPTENLYSPIDYTRSIGTVTKVAIENLIDQMDLDRSGCNQDFTLPTIEAGQNAVIAVSPGIGISRVFASLGVAAIVNGGQSMNPSTQEIVSAFEDLPTDKIIILPNNKNIILTAKAAAELSVKRVEVIPTSTVPQGLAAMMRLIPDGDFIEVVEEMTEALKDVNTGEITTATRSVEIDGVQVHEGEIIALLNGKLVLSASHLQDACVGFLEKAAADQYELITLFYGSDLSISEVSRIADEIRLRFPDQVLEIQEGCQPHYLFIIAIE